VVAAGNVCAVNKGHNFLVTPHAVGAEPLAQVTVEFYV
jgi:hypothetical protein